jgi:hypothetical protein
LYLSATTELLIINLIPQHDPQPDSQLARHRHARLAQTFLNQFAAVETLQLWIAACRMCTGLTPEKPQQGTALFGHSAEPLMLSTGVLPRDDAHITGQRLAISETLRIAQEYFGRQCRFLESESPFFVGRAIAALASDPSSIERTGQLLSSWELARHYSFTDYDGRRPDWGALAIDWSLMPSALVELFLTATRVQLDWLNTLARRTEQFITKLPPVS